MPTNPPEAPPSSTPPADTLGPNPPPSLDAFDELLRPPTPAEALLEATRAASLEGTKMVLELPPATLAAGKRTTLSFFLAYASFVRGLRWVPGFRLEKLVIAGTDYGDGTQRVGGRLYHEHRVLKGDTVFLHVLNTSREDRNFKGNMTIEVSNVVDDDDYACSPTEPSTLATSEAPEPAENPGGRGLLSCLPST